MKPHFVKITRVILRLEMTSSIWGHNTDFRSSHVGLRLGMMQKANDLNVSSVLRPNKLLFLLTTDTLQVTLCYDQKFQS